MANYFVTATHTDAGKTFVSSLLVKALSAKYWKPIQSGSDYRDTREVIKLAGIAESDTFDEVYLLKSPESPHSAAAKEGVRIEFRNIVTPETDRNLIIEGAGGLLVPLNEEEAIVDLIKFLNVPIVLVVPTYLGCINHALLSLECIKKYELDLYAIIFNGEESTEAQKIILAKANCEKYFRVPKIIEGDCDKFNSISLELSQLFL